MQVRVLSPPPFRTKVAGRGSTGLFLLPSIVSKCKCIKGLAKRCRESLILHVEFEHTKFSNFRFSLEFCCLNRKYAFLRVLIGEHHPAHNHARRFRTQRSDPLYASESVATPVTYVQRNPVR